MLPDFKLSKLEIGSCLTLLKVLKVVVILLELHKMAKSSLGVPNVD